MAALALDTHALVKRLKEAGFDDRQAESVTQVVTTSREAFDLATKADLREVELRLEAKISTTVEAARFELIKCVVGTIAFQTAATLGAVGMLLRIGR